MSVKGGPKIVSDGLVFNLDAAGAVSDKGYDPEGLRIEYLIVAGGGGGSGWGDGVGGGAGGFLLNSTKLTAGTHTVTVGAGGGRGTNSSGSRGSNGGDSQIGASLIAYGGGGAGCKTIQDGLDGGSGGGGYGNNAVPHGIGGSGVPGQGNDGGDGTASYRGGSGGGAGEAGLDGTLAVGNLSSIPGARGRVAKIDYIWAYYAGGGGTGGLRGDPSGGLGGGGKGGIINQDGTAGGTNTGGGGGGGGTYSTRATFGGNGGSGIVMFRYRGKQKATGGDSIVYKNGYTIHTFTSSGSFVLDEAVDGLSTSKTVSILKNMGASDYKTGNKGYFSFDGSNQYIEVPTTFTQTNTRTVVLWARITGNYNATGNTRVPILSYFINGSTSNRVWLGIEENKFRMHGWGTTDPSGTSNINDGEWHHLVWTYDYVGQIMNLYVDGVLENGNFSTSSQAGVVVSSSHKYYIAYFRDTYSSFPIGYTQMDLAVFKLYNKILRSDEVLDNYNATKGRFGL